MADHHIDSLKDFDYSKAAENILKSRGLFIVENPSINHKPGNDWWSDVYYPLPNFPDNRFANPANDNNQIKGDGDEGIVNCICPCCNRRSGEDLIVSEEIPDEGMEDIRSIQNTVVTLLNDGRTLFDDVVMPYTGLTLQAVEKRTFDIAFLKPVIEETERKVKLHIREVTTGHLMSIATFDGYNYHIFRGLCIDILKVKDTNDHIKNGHIMSTPYGSVTGKSIIRKLDNDANSMKQLMRTNVKIVLDTSEPFKSSVECIPVNQIIDIQEYDYSYDFTIYEGDLKLLWDDWFQIKDDKDDRWITYVPDNGLPPQELLHPVIEHQKPNYTWE